MLVLENNVKRDLKDDTAPDSWMRHFLENQTEFGINDNEGRWMFDSVTFAGIRSPYNALLSFIVNMMEHPEWQKKVQNEVDRVVGDRLPVFEDLPNLPIVRAIIKEGIRYRFIVAGTGVPHMVEEDDVYEGYFIPKGTLFHANYR
jgi:cytochrome P450